MPSDARNYGLALYELTNQSSDSQLSEVMPKFVEELRQRRLIGRLPEIIDAFSRYADEQAGQQTVIVRSVMALTDEERQKLLKQLKQMTGKEVILDEQLDPSILGGLQIQLGDTIIDTSIRAKLGQLKAAMTGAVS